MNNLHGILCMCLYVSLEFKPVNGFGVPNSVALPLDYRDGLERMCPSKLFFYIHYNAARFFTTRTKIFVALVL
jgi:hypothetical protein